MADAPPAKKLRYSETEEETMMRNALMQMERVQHAIDSLNEQASNEILKIEQKFNSLRKPEYSKRQNFIKNVPGFWPRALLNHPQLGSYILEEEEGALHCLQTLEVEENDDIKSGFKFVFTFAPNDFFENDVMTKEFVLTGETPFCKSTEIKWKEDHNIVEKIKLARQNSEEVEEQISFFEWMTASGDPTSDDFAEAIKDDLWPNPLQYFLSPDMDEAEEVDEEEEEENEEEEEEEEEEPSQEEKDGRKIDVVADLFSMLRKRISYPSPRRSYDADDEVGEENEEQ